MTIYTHISFALSNLSYQTALVTKPSPYKPLFMVPSALGALYFLRSPLGYHTALEYTYASSALAQVFVASSYILINDAPRTLFFRGQKVPAYNLPTLERVIWTIKLAAHPRCTGWSHEPKQAFLPRPPSSTTPTKFLVQQMFALIRDLAIYEAIITYVKSSPSFAADGYSLGEGGTFWRALNVLVVGLAGSISLRICHRMLRILSLCTGISDPQDCPPLFGNILDAYSVRNFWGRVWHQTLRWPGVSHGRFLAYNVFHLDRGSKAAFLVQLYTTFAVNGLIHVAGEYSLIGYWTHRFALQFFLLQAVAITFETMFIEWGSKLSVRGPWRFIGFLWVLMWFTYTVPSFIEPLLRNGLAATAPSFGILATIHGH